MTDPLDNTPEEWRPVKGYETTYSVSNLGRIRREIGHRSPYVRILHQYQATRGGWIVSLCSGGKCKSYNMARLVAVAFMEPIPGKEQVNHKDGSRFNNATSNLEWCNQSENITHRYRVLHKPGPMGERHWKSKLNVEKVLEIRRLYSLNTSINDIAASFNVSYQTIHHVVSGRLWRHVV
jgi:hypothetical protein